MRDDFYRKICKARLQPVLDTIAASKRRGSGWRSPPWSSPGQRFHRELTEIAQFIKGVGLDIPWHVTAFHPTFKMMDRPATPVATLRRAREIGLKAGLRYVYTGNIPRRGRREHLLLRVPGAADRTAGLHYPAV